MLYNKDARELLENLPNASVDVLITDPPYDLTQEEKDAYHKEFLRVCKGDILVFSPPENQWSFPGVFYMFWTKTPSTKNTSKRYSRFVEMIFLYKRSNTWNHNLAWDNYKGVYNDIVDGVTGHPHEKPLSLIERFIKIHSNPGDVILDPFAGSGTILIAAQRLGRQYLGSEIDEHYYGVAENRLKSL